MKNISLSLDKKQVVHRPCRIEMTILGLTQNQTVNFVCPLCWHKEWLTIKNFQDLGLGLREAHRMNQLVPA